MLVSVPATSANLGPGFDTLGVALNLRNEVYIKKSKFFAISIKGEGSKNIKVRKNNLFIKIFSEHYRKLTNTNEKIRFKFTFYNNIPFSRGLGSSSAVIVGAIAAAYEVAGVAISKSKILNLALNYEPHPDNITPAVMGGFNSAVIEKNMIYSIKKDMPDSVKAVIVIPNKAISTAHSRTKLPKSYLKDDVVFNLSRSSLLVSAFFAHRWDLLKIASKDRMHQDIRMKNMPILFEVQKKALENGALMSTLSGSGSTMFNMALREDAKRLEKVLKDSFSEFRVKTLDFDNKGLVVK